MLEARSLLIKEVLAGVSSETVKQHRETAAIQACEAFFAPLAAPADVMARGINRIIGPAIDFALAGKHESCVASMIESVLLMAWECRGLRMQVDRLQEALVDTHRSAPHKHPPASGGGRSISDRTQSTGSTFTSIDLRQELEEERRRSAELANELTLRNLAFANLEQRLRTSLAQVETLKTSHSALDDRQNDTLLDAVARRNLALSQSAALDAKMREMQAGMAQRAEAERWQNKRFDTMTNMFLEREQVLISFTCDEAFASTHGVAAELLHSLMRTRRQLLALATDR